ncbi:MAG: hypothetical protein HQL18_01910, partial [Candidatus Omnitrophica bacterium]|nr:hypothetical protein [Candidatus Omnitrophota bacterium]
LYGIPLAFLMSLALPGLHLRIGVGSLPGGWAVGFVLVALSFMLMLVDAFRRRVGLPKEDLHLAIGIFTILLVQALVYLYVNPASPFGARLASLALSMAGMVVGGGALFLMGMIGALLIQKRVVTLIDLKLITDQPEELFKELIRQAYI